MYLYPYNMGSQGAKELAKAIGAKRIKREKSKFRGTPDKIVINWGNARLPDQVAVCQVINKPEAVNKAGNKLLAFNAMNEWNEQLELDEDQVNIPEFTEDKEVAREWLDQGNIVVARTVLRGHSGAGIVIYDNVDQLEDAPLYVRYVKKTQEYRVHLLNGQVIDQQRKARKKGVEDDKVNWQVRNLDGGFIFMREGVDLPAVALDQAKYALDALDLDFGAVDLIYNEKQDKYYVLEVNTAPGLTGTTLENYAEAFANGF